MLYFLHLNYLLDHNINNLRPCTAAGMALRLIKERASRNRNNKAKLCLAITPLILPMKLPIAFQLLRRIPWGVL